MVAPRALSPAARSACTSACGPPHSWCHPSPTTSSPRSTTAPTMGFGETLPHPRHASSMARRIATSSLLLSLFKPHHRLRGILAAANLPDDPGRDLHPLGRVHDGFHVVPGDDGDHAHAEIEHAAHLRTIDLSGAHEHAEDR